MEFYSDDHWICKKLLDFIAYSFLLDSFLLDSSLGISGYSNLTPGSQVKLGQQYGKAAVLLVFSVSNLHLSFANGKGPQSSTNSSNLK